MTWARLRLAGFYTAWSTFLPTAVADFTRAHPRVQLDLGQLDPRLPAATAMISALTRASRLGR